MASKIVDCFKSSGLFTDKEIENFLDGRGDISFDDVKTAKWLTDKQKDLALRKRRAKLQAIALDKTLKTLDGYGGKSEEALTSILVKDKFDFSRNVSIEDAQSAILASAHAQFIDAMEKYKMKKLGFAQDENGIRNVVSELFGRTTGDADAKAAAKMWTEVTDRLRNLFNSYGGEIDKLDKWVMPQSHDVLKVNKVSAEEWADQVLDLLDYREMGYLQKQDLRPVLVKEVYPTLATEGLSKVEPGKTPPGARGALSKRHSAERFLHFKDDASWLKYQDDFGTGDIFGTMLSHLETMSREIGLMKTLGPNPDANFKYLMDYTRNKFGHKAEVTNRAERIYGEMMGRTYAKHPVWASRGASTRAVIAGAKLGMATISALSDTVFAGMTSAFNGMPVMKTYTRFLKNLNPASKADRRLAARLGLAADYAIDSLQQANRYMEVTGGNRAALKMASFTMKASGLEAWTNAGKRAFALEFSSYLADNLAKGFGDLKPRLRKALTRYGISDSDWSALSKHITEERGVKYLDASKIEDTDLMIKAVGMIRSEMRYAVPEPGARVMSFGKSGTQAGTVGGEIMRFAMQFKSFPGTLMTTHWTRGAMSPDMSGGGRAAYLGALLVGTTVMGAVAHQAKQVARGRDPIDPAESPGVLLARAFVQGGGLGIYGDFLLSDQNRFGQSLAGTLAGPAVGELERGLMKTIIGNIQQAIKGEETGFLPETARFLEGMAPTQWWNDLFIQRLMFDQINRQIDPDWDIKMRRAETKLYRETGQEHWWKPGEMTPER